LRTVAIIRSKAAGRCFARQRRELGDWIDESVAPRLQHVAERLALHAQRVDDRVVDGDRVDVELRQQRDDVATRRRDRCPLRHRTQRVPTLQKSRTPLRSSK
jgi:hypothetical protein